MPMDFTATTSLSYSYDPAGRLAKEIYPNGRAIEFGYDAGWRLSTVKDPFGFVNTVGLRQ